jgi:hypothetical protein
MSSLANNQNNSPDPSRKPRNPGEEIEYILALAENNPQEALNHCASILKNSALPKKRALAFRGLGRVAEKFSHYKQRLSSDKEILKEIAKDINSGDDLKRCFAAWAIEVIGFPEDAIHHLEGGGLTDPPYRIRNNICNQKFELINKIENKQKFDPLGNFTAEYERLLEFWIYGLTEYLFNANSNSYKYQDFVKDVINLLHIRGVYLGLASQNYIPQLAALNKAEEIFKESEQTEDALNKAKEIFKESKQTEDRLYPYIENYLINSNYLIEYRVKAAYIIAKAKNPDRFRLLTICLLEETKLRNAAVEILKQDQQNLSKIEPKAIDIVNAILFESEGLDQPEIINFTIQDIKERITLAEKYRDEISTTFKKALDSAKSLTDKHKMSDSNIINFLRKIFKEKHSKNLQNLQDLIKEFKNQIEEIKINQNKIKNNYDLLLNICENIKSHKSLKLNSNDQNNIENNWNLLLKICEDIKSNKLLKLLHLDIDDILHNQDKYINNEVYQELLKIDNNPQTFSDCQKILPKLTELQEQITTQLKKLQEQISKKIVNYEKEISNEIDKYQHPLSSVYEVFTLLVGSGFMIIIFTYIITGIIYLVLSFFSWVNSGFSWVISFFTPSQTTSISQTQTSSTSQTSSISYKCPPNTQLYKRAETNENIILICTAENDSKIPKYYVGYDRTGAHIQLSLSYSKNNVFVSKNGKYTYKLDFNQKKVIVIFPNGKSKTLKLI